jgi:hypothetical protein
MTTTITEEARAGHSPHGHHDRGHGEHCEVRVRVPFNNREVFLNTGELSVETVKRLACIPLTDDIEQLVESKIVPLPDDGKVHITGCEIFLHHPKDGGSS